jgi:hypothetical protein
MAGVVGVIAVVGLIGSMLAVWTRSTLLDTDRFMALVRPVITSDVVGDAVGGYVTDRAFAALEVDRRRPWRGSTRT